MFQLELQPEYNPSFFSPDWLDQDRVELDWNSFFFFFIWINYSLVEFFCPPQNYEKYTIKILKFLLAVFFSWKEEVKK